MPPEQQFIAPISGIQITKSIEGTLAIIMWGHVDVAPTLSCKRCGSVRVKLKAYYLRQVKHAFWTHKLVYLNLKVPKLHCLQCRCYFMAPVPGVLPKKRATENYRQEVFHLHQGGMTAKHLSITHKISTATVERWYQDYVVRRVNELRGRPCPIVMGIDEHFFSRKQGYATTLVDLRNHKVFDVVLGRSEKSLEGFLRGLRGRDRVKVVVMDLSETYRSIVKKYFPNALIVADRFHVIRLLNQHFMDLWKSLDPEGRKNRGLLSLMRRHEWKLEPEQKENLLKYFEKYPALKLAYDFKQGLAELLLKKQQSKESVKDLIPQLLWHVNECLQSPWIALQTLGRTFQSWLEPIARMWRFTKTNGITEGLHNKMEMISRRAFGFRNFKNYRLRVIALCGWNGVFTVRT